MVCRCLKIDSLKIYLPDFALTELFYKSCYTVGGTIQNFNNFLTSIRRSQGGRVVNWELKIENLFYFTFITSNYTKFASG